MMKILLLGNSGAGKSCLITRFVEDKFVTNFYNTIGVDFKLKNMQIDDTKIKMQVVSIKQAQWDTAGQDRFRTITSNYFRGADGIVIVYDITERSSFEGVQGWIAEMQKYTDQNCQAILVANKADLNERRQISNQEGTKYADQIKIPLIETSARDGQNVAKTFQTIGRLILNKRSGTKMPAKKAEQKLKKQVTKNKKESGCC